MKDPGLTVAIFVISCVESGHRIAADMIWAMRITGRISQTTKIKVLGDLVLTCLRLIVRRCRFKAGFGEINLTQQLFPAFELLFSGPG